MKMEQIHALSSKIKPSFTVPMEMIEEAKEWKVGSTYSLTLHVTQTGVEQMPDGSQHVTFQIDEMEGEEHGVNVSDEAPKGNGVGNKVEGTDESFITA